MRKFMMGGAAALLAASALAGQALALAPQSPAAGSDDIRAARASAAVDALVFSYTRTVTRQGKPEVAESGTVTLGGDFTAIDQAAEHTLDDFALCRVLTWKTGAPDLDNQSCFWWPAFRLGELHNRQALNRILTASFKDKVPDNLDPYWSEQELFIQDDPTAPLKAHTGAAAVEYSLNGRVVVRTSLTGSAFTPQERQRVARYLSRHVDLHPQVVRAILASRQLPSDLTIERYETDQPATETFHFAALQHQARDYPLPAHLTSSLVSEARGDSAEARGLAQAVAEANGTGPQRPDFDTLMNRLQAAIDAKQGLTATLLFQEVATQFGGSIVGDPARLGRIRAIMPGLQAVFAEPDSARFMQASSLAGDGKPTPQNEAAAKYLANAKALDALPFGTFRYITFANLVRSSGDTSGWDKAIFTAMPPLADCYWIHIAAYPWIGNSYKDLGDMAYQDFAMDKAWRAWDLGRAIDPDWHTGGLNSVATYEDSLRAALPDNF
jgi:hypothetical protein